MLIVRAKAAEDHEAFERNGFLAQNLRPGNIIVSSNWDDLIERYCAKFDIPLRLPSSSHEFPNDELTLLKLHRSVDWCAVEHCDAAYDATQFAALSELQNPRRKYTQSVPTDPKALVRVRGARGETWRRVKSRAREPWLVTMVTGKRDKFWVHFKTCGAMHTEL